MVMAIENLMTTRKNQTRGTSEAKDEDSVKEEVDKEKGEALVGKDEDLETGKDSVRGKALEVVLMAAVKDEDLEVVQEKFQNRVMMDLAGAVVDHTDGQEGEHEAGVAEDVNLTGIVEVTEGSY